MWARWETAFLAVFHGVHALFVRSPFIRRRADLADRRMSTPLVIEHLDIGEQLPFGLAAAVEAIGELRLHGREEALHHRIVVAVAAAAHATDDAVLSEEDLIIFARVRAALLGVMEQTDLGTSTLERHLERVDRHVAVVHRACPEDVERAIAAAVGAFEETRQLASWQRERVLHAVAAGITARRDELAGRLEASMVSLAEADSRPAILDFRAEIWLFTDAVVVVRL